MNAASSATGSTIARLAAGSRIIALGSLPSAIALISSRKRRWIMTMPRSLGARYSCERSAMRPLPDPSHEILIHHMAGNPAPSGGVCDRPLPSRDAVLDIGLALPRHAAEMPHDAERVFVVDGHAELDVIPGEQSVRPQAHPADRPRAVMLARIGADALVLKSVFEFAEIDLDVLRRVGARGAAEADAPVRVGPFEMHRVDRVFLALEPIAWNLGLDDLAEAVLPREEFPVRHERPRFGTEIGP